jgi:hypothetical protein
LHQSGFVTLRLKLRNDSIFKKIVIENPIKLKQKFQQNFGQGFHIVGKPLVPELQQDGRLSSFPSLIML